MKSEIKIGLLGIIALLTLIYGYKFLKGQNVFEGTSTYYIRYADVGHLEVSNGVFVNGFKVGSVLDIQLDDQDANYLIVTISVEKGIDLPKSTVAVISPDGIMGQKLITLEFDQLCTGDCIPTKSFINGSTEGLLNAMLGKPEELGDYYTSLKKNIDGDERLKASLANVESTIQSLTKISAEMAGLLQASQASLKNTLSNMDKVTSEIANNRSALSTSIQNMETFTQQLSQIDIKDLTSHVDQSVTSADQTIKQFQQTLRSTDQSLKNVQSLLNGLSDGKGSAGKFLTDETLMVNLEQATANLNFLLQDIRLNPKRYINVSVFGKKQKEYTPPENDPAFE